MSAKQRRKNPCPGLKVKSDQGSWVENNHIGVYWKAQSYYDIII